MSYLQVIIISIDDKQSFTLLLVPKESEYTSIYAFLIAVPPLLLVLQLPQPLQHQLTLALNHLYLE